jgi:hypothetical protein
VRRAVFGHHASDNLGDAVLSYALLGLLGADQSVSLADREDIGTTSSVTMTTRAIAATKAHP